MKKKMVLGLLVCMLFCGCELPTAKDVNHQQDAQVTPGAAEQQSTANADGNDVQARLAYYEQLVVDLRQELLNVKTEMYANRVEYEARIAELESAVSAGAGESTKDGAVFGYTVEDGKLTVTSYTGTDAELVIPEKIDGYAVSAIGDRAFADNARLVSVSVPEGVESLGWFAFSGCVALKNISLPSSVQAISYGAFQNCPSDLTVCCKAGSYADRYAISYGIRVSR